MMYSVFCLLSCYIQFDATPGGQTYRKKNRMVHTQINRHRQSVITQTFRQTEKKTDKNKLRKNSNESVSQTDNKINSQTANQMNRQENRQPNTQPVSPVYRQPLTSQLSRQERQADIQRDRHITNQPVNKPAVAI